MKKATGSLLGVVIGFVIGQVAGAVTTAMRNRVEGRSIRNLLALEIDQNLRLLDGYWTEVTADQDPSHPDRLAAKAAQVPLPLPREGIWSGHAARLASVPSLDPGQLRAVWGFYEQLILLHQLHGRLRRAQGTSTPPAGEAQAATGEPTPFAGFQQGILGLLDQGNPLGDPLGDPPAD